MMAKIPVENAENTDWEDIISDTQEIFISEISGIMIITARIWLF